VQTHELEPAIVDELNALSSIYEDMQLFKSSTDANTLRYQITTTLPAPHDSVSLRVLVSLPSAYPVSSPPQLQLLSQYIGAFRVSSALFGTILRTYISSDHGIDWSQGSVAVFDGMENVIERCSRWYTDRLTRDKVAQLQRDEDQDLDDVAATARDSPASVVVLSEELPANLTLVAKAEPITDRKSAFVGRACEITDPTQVQLVLEHLMSDRHVARAAHPIIRAWRCTMDGVLHQDNDDDGETAAGSRLAHLLQILEVDNVLVIVTRYFGGIHLGPDRFKHINQAARNALELGGFLNDTSNNLRTHKSRQRK